MVLVAPYLSNIPEPDLVMAKENRDRTQTELLNNDAYPQDVNAKQAVEYYFKPASFQNKERRTNKTLYWKTMAV
jgi:hypothetical protein